MPVEAAGDNVEQPTPQALGATLAAERERQGLSRADAAQRLHMSPSQVEALERGDYQSLPRGTFLRGFVRNYAKVLGLEPDSVLALLAEGAPREAAPRIVVPTQNIRFDPIGERLSNPYVRAATLAFVVVAIAFAAMYWVMFVRGKPPALAGRAAEMAAHSPTPPAPAVPIPTLPHDSAPPDTGEPAAKGPPPADAAAGALSPSRPAPAKAAGETKAAAAKPGSESKAAPPKSGSDTKPPKPVSETKVASAKPATEPPDAADRQSRSGPRKTIHFHFAGDSWVEIRDAGGKLVYQKLNPAGSDADVAARPPVEVIVGNAPEVRMTYDGADFPLEPHTNVAVARFTLE